MICARHNFIACQVMSHSGHGLETGSSFSQYSALYADTIWSLTSLNVCSIIMYRHRTYVLILWDFSSIFVESEGSF